VVTGVAGVEQHEHGARAVDVLAYLLDGLGARRVSVEQGDQGAQRVRLDRGAVVRADLDVDATTRPWSMILQRLAENTNDPPWATPVSTITSGRREWMTSWRRTMSSGSWMIGRPSHVKL